MKKAQVYVTWILVHCAIIYLASTMPATMYVKWNSTWHAVSLKYQDILIHSGFFFPVPQSPERGAEGTSHRQPSGHVFRSHINKAFILSHSVLPEALMEWIKQHQARGTLMWQSHMFQLFACCIQQSTLLAQLLHPFTSQKKVHLIWMKETGSQRPFNSLSQSKSQYNQYPHIISMQQ